MINKLSKIIPLNVLTELNVASVKFDINTELRLAHFLSQCAHESGSFKLLVENLNYSTDGLLNTFPKYFKDRATAESYARKPEKIANRVYANRMGNGDEASGEGFKFRGRGYIQLTGKNNYKDFSAFIGEDCVSNPDLVSSKYALSSAAFFFKVNNIFKICDKGSTDDVIKLVTRKVNGGSIGFNDRKAKFKIFYSALKS